MKLPIFQTFPNVGPFVDFRVDPLSRSLDSSHSVYIPLFKQAFQKFVVTFVRQTIFSPFLWPVPRIYLPSFHLHLHRGFQT